MTTSAELPCWPAAERNKDAILEVLRGVLPARGNVLEVASGTGQHVVHFAQGLAALQWQPSEFDPDHRVVIDERVRRSGLSNVHPVLALDVTADPWPVQTVDAIFSANLIHISPREVGAALLRGACQCLAPGGVLLTYGPYLEGMRSSQGNLDFHRSLQARDERWGVWELEAFEERAHAEGLELRERIVMPANNLTLVWQRRAPR